MNLNELAVAITKLEGGRVNLSIAQVKEVIRCLGDVLRAMSGRDQVVLWQRMRDVGVKWKVRPAKGTKGAKRAKGKNGNRRDACSTRRGRGR